MSESKEQYTTEKTPPHDLDAEESVLGSVLIDPEAMVKVAPTLTAEEFYREKHRWAYECCLAIYNRDEKCDQITVAHELARRQQLEASGGAAFLSHLVSQVPSAVHVEHYAGIVGRMALMRRLISASNQIAGIGYESPHDSDEAIARAEELLGKVRNGHSKDDSVMYSEDMIDQYPLYLEKQAEMMAKTPPLTMGWLEFDDKVIFRNGTASLVGGISSSGKTIFAEHIRDRAQQGGLNVALFRNEVAPWQIFNRLMCRKMKVAGPDGEPRAPRFKDLEAGEYYDSGAVMNALEELKQWEGKYADVYCPGWGPGKICAKMRQLAAKGRADVVVVDYLQQIPLSELTGKNGLNHAQAVGAAVQMMKDCAAGLPGSPPLIIMSQLNYAGELRNSGEPQEKANAYIRIYNRWKAKDGNCISDCPHGRVSSCHQHCIDLVISKNTFGETGLVSIWHDPPRFRFYSEE